MIVKYENIVNRIFRGETRVKKIYKGIFGVFGVNPFTAETYRILKENFPAKIDEIIEYGNMHPQIVPFIEEDPIYWATIVLSYGSNMITYIQSYKSCTYIESTGTQRIETNLNGYSGTNRIEHIIQFTKLNARQLMGQNSNNGYWGINGTGNYERYTNSGIRGGGKDLVVMDNNISNLTVNGIKTNLPGALSWSGNGTYQIFQLTGSYSCYAKLFYFSAWKNSTPQIIGFPCYRKSDGVIGMFDVVNGVFYINKGAGVFNKGNDAVVPNHNNYLNI